MYLTGVLFGALAGAPVTFLKWCPSKNVDKEGLDRYYFIRKERYINSFKVNSISLQQSEAFLF